MATAFRRRSIPRRRLRRYLPKVRESGQAEWVVAEEAGVPVPTRQSA